MYGDQLAAAYRLNAAKCIEIAQRSAEPEIKLPSRAVAIRRLAERGGLANSIIPRRRSKGSRRKAAEMADREIEHLGDQATTNEERARRKRQLIKGPREFRGVRADWRKNKG